MMPVGSPEERTLNHQTGSTDLAKLRALIADDAFAATFQTMGRYRTALLQVASAIERSPASNVEPVVTNHSVDANEMAATRAKPARPLFRYRDGEIRDANGRQLMLLMASNCTKKFRDGVGRAVVGILNANKPHEQSLSRDCSPLP